MKFSPRLSPIVAAGLVLLGGFAWVSAQPARPAAQPAAAPATQSEAAPIQGGVKLSLFELLDKGGPLMWPIYLCSVVMLAFMFERIIRLRRTRVIPRGFAKAVQQMAAAGQVDQARLASYCADNPSPVARIFQAALTHLNRPLNELENIIEDAGGREARKLVRPCRAFSIIGEVAPLLGLLGTVWGMILAFMKVADLKVMGSPSMLAEGIYQALVTTAAGLSVAIPAVVLYAVFTDKVERLVGEIDQLTIQFVDALVGKEKPETRKSPAPQTPAPTPATESPV
jgi:biopolymer transport protein ExbB